MDYRITLPQWAIREFDRILDESIQCGKERFGLCHYDPKGRRILDVVPPEYFENNNQVMASRIDVLPSPGLMQVVKEFNRYDFGVLSLCDMPRRNGNKMRLAREKGILVPYHTHIGEDSFFSSNDDLTFSFYRQGLLMDIVISENARDRGIKPPICVTLNNRQIPFQAADMQHYEDSIDDLVQLDRLKEYEPGTHSELSSSQICANHFRTIDFTIDY